MTFIPTPFETPITAPSAFSGFRAVSYLSPSEYRFAPTAVGTQNLVKGSKDPQVDSLQSLANVIARASSMMDVHCFHRGDGSFAGSVTNEQMVVKMKPDGSLVLITNLRPLRQVIGLGLGPTASQISNIGQNAADNIVLGEKTITIPGGFCAGYPTPWFGGWPTVNGACIAVYSYVSGWPHSTLAADVDAGGMSLTVNPPVPGASEFFAALPGNPLTIKDGQNTETVVIESVSGLTVNTVSGLQYAHQVPEAPDALSVTALPDNIEEACIALTNLLIKTQGMRAMILPAIGNATPAQKQALARAGALADFELAAQLLHPFVTAYAHA